MILRLRLNPITKTMEKEKTKGTPLQFIASFIWNASEYLNLSLGDFAPTVFGWMVGSKGKRIK